MYAHQVIERLVETLFDNNAPTNVVLCAGIRGSQKFHLSSIIGIHDINAKRLKRYIGELDHRILMDEFVFDQLPYDDVWFDWALSSNQNALTNKIGCLAHKVDGGSVQFFIFLHDARSGDWVFNPYYWEISKDEVRTGVRGDVSKEGYEWYRDAGLYCLLCIQTALSFLSCKNVGTEKHDPPLALNKKRQKTGKQPIFTYHTLVLKPVGKKQESIPRHLWNNRIHLMRGHFKTYTADNPLFGRITGRFWWQPSVRGKNKDGVVIKDYEVRI